MRNDALVKIWQLARILSVSVQWLRKETDENRIPYLQAGKDVLYSPEAVKSALAERAQGEQRRKQSILARGA
ncbi:MAG: hypothetical protein A2Y12_05515 [Planctomycetes bacterium GWF2_42_9]|nr:MAG: hypothetical protein A2Y12_05515 [Planctomycetes bacterium GWF2_42_9]